MGAIVLIVGVIGIGAVIAAVVVFAITRSRRNSGAGQLSPGAGNYRQNMGYPPLQPIHPPAQQPYPPTPLGYSNPLGQTPQHPNSYPQQPPYQGQ